MLFKSLMLCLIPFCLLRAEETPVRRRPRILVYDEAAKVVPVKPKVQDASTAEADLQKRIRQDMKAPGALENPVNSVSFLPTLGSAVFSPPEETDEGEEESWITPQNFLLEEDLMSKEDLLKTEAEQEELQSGELEITDWEALQKSMIEEALNKKEVEMTDEEIEAFLANENLDETRLNQSGGLDLDVVAPVDELRQVVPSGESGSAARVNPDMGGFVPVLPTREQLNGEVSRPQRERDPRLELTGSRNLLNNLKEKWGQPSDRRVESPASRPVTAALPGERLMPQGLPSASGVSGLGANNPAVSAFPASAPAPVTREIPLRQPRNEPRIRSTLGLPPGM